MLTTEAQSIVLAYEADELEAARSLTSEVTHLRRRNRHIALCGARTGRGGSGGRDCLTCQRKLHTALGSGS